MQDTDFAHSLEVEISTSHSRSTSVGPKWPKEDPDGKKFVQFEGVHEQSERFAAMSAKQKDRIIYIGVFLYILTRGGKRRQIEEE